MIDLFPLISDLDISISGGTLLLILVIVGILVGIALLYRYWPLRR